MFKVGQKVWCVMFGEGVVTSVLPEGAKYPVEVNFGGGVYDHYTIDGKYTPNATQTLFPYPVEIVKKVAKPSINWKHVQSRFRWIAQDAEGGCWLYEDKPVEDEDEGEWKCSSGDCTSAEGLISLIPGTCDWEDSLVERPVM